jgi:hypothetical protein
LSLVCYQLLTFCCFAHHDTPHGSSYNIYINDINNISRPVWYSNISTCKNWLRIHVHNLVMRYVHVAMYPCECYYVFMWSCIHMHNFVMGYGPKHRISLGAMGHSTEFCFALWARGMNISVMWPDIHK